MPDDFFDTALDWRQTLSVGDIILFKFPIYDPVDRSEARPRPCLVSDLTLSYGVQFIELVPGFDGVPDAPDGTEVTVDWTALIHAAQGGHAHLHFPTRRAGRFDIAHPGFATDPDGGSPLIGRLTGAALLQLDLLRAQREASRARHLAQKRARKRRRR